MTRLGMVLSAYGQKYDLNGQELAAEIGIGKSNISRIKAGKMPDARNLTRIMAWLTDVNANKEAE